MSKHYVSPKGTMEKVNHLNEFREKHNINIDDVATPNGVVRETDGDWEERFNQRFPVPCPPKHAVRDFIRTEIQKAREEGYKDGLQTNKEK